MTLECSRARLHTSYDNPHVNVWFRLAWRNGEQVPYPGEWEVADRVRLDRGRTRQGR